MTKEEEKEKMDQFVTLANELGMDIQPETYTGQYIVYTGRFCAADDSNDEYLDEQDPKWGEEEDEDLDEEDEG